MKHPFCVTVVYIGPEMENFEHMEFLKKGEKALIFHPDDLKRYLESKKWKLEFEHDKSSQY